MNNLTKIVLLVACFVSSHLAAQQELMMYSLPDLWHSSSLNPAFFPEGKKIAVGLPGLGLDLAHSGDITYQDIFSKDGDKTKVDFSNALSKLDQENNFFAEQRIETFSFGLKIKKLYLSLGHANRLSGSIQYPKILPELIWNGNAQYIGQTLNIAPQATIFNWNEWYAGVAADLGKFRVGLRLKMLNGTASLLTDDAHKSATIYTNPDIYQLSLTSDYGLWSSSLISAIDTSGLGFDVKLADLDGSFFTKNRGFAYDLGLQYAVNAKLNLSLSVLDNNSSIKWTENANYHRSQGSYTYNGVDLPGSDLITGADSLSFEQKLDTLNDIFKFNKSAQSFKTSLPSRVYAGAQYSLTDRLALSLGFFAQDAALKRKTATVALGARWTPLHWLSVGAMYSANNRSKANFGGHLVIKPGPVQLYFASDNLLNAFSPKTRPAFNLRSGLSLVF